MGRQGYLLIFKQFLENPLLDDKPYCRGYAWLCLLALTNSKKEFQKVKNGALIPVERGECGLSEYALADKFGWSRGKVRRWLNELEKNCMIRQKIVENHSIIKVLNYDKFQNGTTKKQPTVPQNNSENTNILDQKIKQIVQQTILQNFNKIVPQNNSENTSILDQSFNNIGTAKKTRNGHNILNSNTSYINISLSNKKITKEEREILEKYVLKQKRKPDNLQAYIKTLIKNGDWVEIVNKEKQRLEKLQQKKIEEQRQKEEERELTEEEQKQQEKEIEEIQKKIKENLKRRRTN